MINSYFNARIEREIKILETMVEIYCKDFHNSKEGFCTSCEELLNYSRLRLEKCPFGNNKPVCNKCSVHCYREDMRFKIKDIMKYSGPRMLYSHPLMTFCHFLDKFLIDFRGPI